MVKSLSLLLQLDTLIVHELVWLVLESGKNALGKRLTISMYAHRCLWRFQDLLLVCQVSGASMLGDWPVTGDRIDNKTYSDVDDDIYEIEKRFPEDLSPVRKVDQVVVDVGEELGVKTYVVPPPLICKSIVS